MDRYTPNWQAINQPFLYQPSNEFLDPEEILNLGNAIPIDTDHIIGTGKKVLELAMLVEEKGGKPKIISIDYSPTVFFELLIAYHLEHTPQDDRILLVSNNNKIPPQGSDRYKEKVDLIIEQAKKLAEMLHFPMIDYPGTDWIENFIYFTNINYQTLTSPESRQGYEKFINPSKRKTLLQMVTDGRISFYPIDFRNSSSVLQQIKGITPPNGSSLVYLSNTLGYVARNGGDFPVSIVADILSIRGASSIVTTDFIHQVRYPHTNPVLRIEKTNFTLYLSTKTENQEM